MLYSLPASLPTKPLVGYCITISPPLGGVGTINILPKKLATVVRRRSTRCRRSALFFNPPPSPCIEPNPFQPPSTLLLPHGTRGTRGSPYGGKIQ